MRSVSESLATKCLTVAPTPPACSAAHVGDADPRRQQRVLAEALEVPPAVGRPVQVHGRREQHVDALAPRTRTPAGARAPRPAPRPSVAASAVGDGTFADVSRSSQRSPRTPAGPSETTRRRRPAAGSAMQRPEVCAGEQPHLLLQRQRRHARGEVAAIPVVVHGAGCIARPLAFPAPFGLSVQRLYEAGELR